MSEERNRTLSDELEILVSIYYKEGELVLSGGPCSNVITVEDIRRNTFNCLAGAIHITVFLAHEMEHTLLSLFSVHLKVDITLGPLYLLNEPPTIALECPGLALSFLQSIQAKAISCAVPGQPCLFDILQHATETLSTLSEMDLCCELVKPLCSQRVLPHSPGLWRYVDNVSEEASGTR